jgi:hypothetical protein
VSDFFGPLPPPPPEPPEHRPPRWSGPPDNEVGVPLPVRVELARTEILALAILGLVVFSTGFSFTFSIVRRARPRPYGDAFPPFHPRGGQPGALRFGIQFADGAKATASPVAWPRNPGETPSGPLLIVRGSGGGGRSWNSNIWVWPLPPSGPLAFVCDWQAEGIALTRREIDAKAILDAAAQVEQLWPDDRPEGGRWTE